MTRDSDQSKKEAWSEGGSGSLDLEAQLLSALDPELLYCVLTWRMPFGRHETWPLLDLPEPYVVWMHRNAQLEGKLGKVMALLYEIKVNGLEGLLGKLSREEIARLGEQVERGR